MADSDNISTYLTVVTTVTEVPGPVTVTTTFTVLVPGSGTATRSFMPSPMPSLSPPKSSSLRDTTTSTTPGVVTVTASPVSTSPVPANTSFAAEPTVSAPASHHVGLPKVDVIVLAVVVPVVSIVTVLAVWYMRRRNNKQYISPPHETQGIPLQRWSAKASILCSTRNESVDDLPWQVMPDEESEDTKYGRHPSTSLSLGPMPPAPRLSPLRPVLGRPSRPCRPISLSASIRDATRTNSPGSYQGSFPGSFPGGTIPESDDALLAHNSIGGARSPPQQGWEGNAMEVPRRTHDGTRRAFYETATNRNLSLARLSRPSDRLDSNQQSDPERALTPNPLRIVKSIDGAGSELDLAQEIYGGTRRPCTDPLDSNLYTPLRSRGSHGHGLMGGLNPIHDAPLDAGVRMRRQEATLNYLEGVVPVGPPPVNYRASSVYSRNEWGSPILKQEDSPPPTSGQNETAEEDKEEPEGKGKGVDRSEHGAYWI